MESNVILGTAKFGIPSYGFSSSKGQSTCNEILDLSYRYGIRVLDTSPRYGDSERLIGDYHSKNDTRFDICTKVDNLEPQSLRNDRSIYNSIIESIKNTRVDCIETLYLHQNEMEIISDKNIMHSLEKIRNDGLVKKIGVSIYSKEECEFALDSDIYDVIQMPISVMDSFIYSELVDDGCAKEIVARSVFLQGTLLNRDNIKSQVKQSEDMLKYLSELDKLALKHEVGLSAMACAFVLSLPKVKSMIVGTTVKENLLHIIDSSKLTMSDELVFKISQLSSEYKKWGNPRNW